MSDEVKIEKGIPIPRAGEGNGTWTTVIAAMEVGDSFVADSPPGTYYAAARYVKAKVAVRRLDKGFRVWRVK